MTAKHPSTIAVGSLVLAGLLMGCIASAQSPAPMASPTLAIASMPGASRFTGYLAGSSVLVPDGSGSIRMDRAAPLALPAQTCPTPGHVLVSVPIEFDATTGFKTGDFVMTDAGGLTYAELFWLRGKEPGLDCSAQSLPVRVPRPYSDAPSGTTTGAAVFHVTTAALDGPLTVTYLVANAEVRFVVWP